MADFKTDFAIHLDGTKLQGEEAGAILGIRVFQTRAGASAFEVIVSDPDLKWQGKPTFTDCKEVKIELGEAGKLKQVFDGEVTAWRTELERSGPTVLVLRGLDRSHRMMRARKTRTYANATPIDCARQIAADYGLTPKTRGGAPPPVKTFRFQANQTDFDFLRQMADMEGYQFFVEGNELHFERPQIPSSDDAEFTFGEQVKTFLPVANFRKPAASVEVGAWDVSGKTELTGAAQTGDELWSVPGVKPGADLAKFTSTKPEVALVDSQVATQEHADTVAKAALTKRAMEFITAEVEVQGNPRVKPGALVNIKKVGPYSGHYLVTEANHFYDAAGYNCIFYVARDKWGNSSQAQQQQAAAKQQHVQAAAVAAAAQTQQRSSQPPPGEIRFLRVLDDDASIPQPVDSPVAVALDAAVVGRLHRYQQRPLPSEVVSLTAPAGINPVTLQTSSGSVAIAMREENGVARSEKKLLFWYGVPSALGGAQWDDLQLVDVSASGSAPFETLLQASGGNCSGKLGLIDVLAEDPDSPGAFRTLRHGVFRTRSPNLRFILPNLALDKVRVLLDDGEDATDDELDISALVHPQGPVTTVQVPQYVRLGQAVTGVTNRAGGRDRVFRRSVEAPPSGGDVGLFVFGENRVRIELAGGPLKLFSAWSLHYLDAEQTVPAGSGELEPAEGRFGVSFFKSSLTLDFKDGAADAEVSRALHALRLKPVGYCGRYRILEGRTLRARTSQEIDELRNEIAGYGDQLITGVARTPVLLPVRGETGFQERLPAAIAGDYNVANHTFNNAHELHWHHFVLHTFPAHRLIESRILAENQPERVSVAGAHFVTNSAFLRPSVEPQLQRIRDLDAQNGGKKIAIFGHTDSVGSEAHNDALSLSRGRAMNALLRHQIGFWYDRFDQTGRSLGPGIADRQWALHELGLYNGPIDGVRAPALDAAQVAFRAAHPGTGAGDASLRQRISAELRTRVGAVLEPITHESRWGTNEMREMLRRLGFYNGTPSGPITAAVTAFQQSRQLTADGSPGVATWIELIRQYQLALMPAPLADARFHVDAAAGVHGAAIFGCGMAFPAMPLGPNRESEQNRRVEVVFRTNPVQPINNALLGAAVPYLDWMAAEIDATGAAAAGNVVVALTDSGLGRGPLDNWSGDRVHETNPLQIRGERLVRPTNTTAAVPNGPGTAVSNAAPAVVNPDGDLRNVDDSTTGSGIGHGTAVMTCLGAEAPVEISGTALGPTTAVLGTAPHVKIRPIQATGNMFAFLQALEVIAADPDVKVFSTSLLFQNIGLLTAAQRRALQERAQEMLTRGKIGFAAAANYNGNPLPNGNPGVYHTVTTQFGSIAGDRRNSRSTFTGANEYQQRLAVIGASKRMGLTPHPEMGPPVMAVNDGPQLNPGQFETATMFSYIGEQVALHTPGEQIRALTPTGTVEANPPFFGTQNPAAVGANLTVGNTDGTSFATPMTAGIAAELMLVDPSLQQPGNHVRVLEYLEATADPLPNLNPNAGRNWPNAMGVSVTAQRVNDPTVAGNPGHPAFSNIRRTHFWKAVLAAVNGGLSSEGRTSVGGKDNFFTRCDLKDDAATTWYGFELRTLFPDAVLWFRKPGGELVEASDAGALFPNNRVLASAWICTDAFDAPSGPQRFVLPAFPWLPATLTAAGRTPYFMAQISIEKAKLADYQALLLHLHSVDPRVSDDPPVLEIRVDDRASLRNKSTIPAAAPEAWKQAIRIHLDAFDDFVFHVTQKRQPLAGFRLVAPQRRTFLNAGEEIEVLVYAVDAQGFLTDQAPATVTVTHDGTNGDAANGVSFNGAPVAQAGAAVNFGAGGDPRCMARLRVLDRTTEDLTLTIDDGTHPAAHLALTVQQSAASTGFALTLRRRGGGALDDARPPRAAEELELEVRAVDDEGRTFTGFTGEVHLGVERGLAGRAGAPQIGVHLKQHAADPFRAAAFTYTFVAADQGVHVFPIIDFSAGPLQMRAESGARSGLSQQVEVHSAAAAASFRVQATTPQTVGNAFDVVVTAVDASGNIVEDFTGTVTLSRLSGTAPVLGPPRQGVFIADSQTPTDDTWDFVASDLGVHRFRVTCYTAENVRFRARSGAIQGDSAAVVLQGGGAVAPARFTMDVEGASRAGRAFSVRVTAVDAQGRRLTGFTSNVQLSIVGALAPPPALNPAAHVFAAADQGQFVFSVTSQRSGVFRVQADSAGVPPSQTAPITIGSGPLDHFRVLAPPAVHRNINFNVQVTAQDVFNNTVTDFLGNVQVLSTAGGVLGSHAFALADNGTFAVQIQLATLGVQQVRATDQNFGNLSNNITVVP